MPAQQLGMNVGIYPVKSSAEADAQLQENELRRMTLTAAVEQRKLQVQTAQKKQQREQWLAGAAKQYVHDDGTPDFVAISREALKVDPEFGLELTDHFGKMQTQAADLRTKELKNQLDSYAMVAGLAEHVSDQASYDRFKAAAKAVDPEVDGLPDQFDPAITAQIIDRGRLNADYNKRRMESIKEARQGTLDADKWLAQNLSLAQSQEDIDDDFQGAAMLFGLDAKALGILKGKYGAQFTPDYAKRASELAMTPEQRGLAADRAADNVRQDAAARETVRHNRAMESGGGGGGMTTQAVSRLPPQAVSVYDRVVVGVPGTRIGSIRDGMSRLASTGAPESEIKSFLKLAAVETLGQADRTAMIGRMQTLTALKDAETLLSQVPTGYIKGTWEDTMRALGNTSDPRLVELGTRMGTILANYMRSISGAAIADKEAERLMKLIPNYKNSLTVNKGQLKGFGDALRSFDNAFYQYKFGDHYDWVMGTGTTQSGAPSSGSAPAADYVFDPKTGKLTKKGGS